MRELPKASELVSPLIEVLKAASHPLSIQEIESQVAANLQVPDDLRNIIRMGNRTEFNYRLSWARTRAKNLGLIQRTSSKYWTVV